MRGPGKAPSILFEFFFERGEPIFRVATSNEKLIQNARHHFVSDFNISIYSEVRWEGRMDWGRM